MQNGERDQLNIELLQSPLKARLAASPRLAKAYEIAAQICDPEIPVLTIADLGVLRDIREAAGALEIIITPTYSGCPAMDMIGVDLTLALNKAGFDRVKISLVLSPAWTSDWLTHEGREKLKAYGIAPPAGKASRRALFGEEEVPCPHCDAKNTTRISEFGSTSCKAQWRCNACREPFDYFKCL